jgi:hypothetical protein
MTDTRAYRTWSERLDAGVLTKGEIQQFGAAITRRATGLNPHGRQTNLTGAEAEKLYVRIQAKPVLLTPEHTTQGLTWFAKRAAKALDMAPELVDEIVANFAMFSWDGTIETAGYYQNGTLPVWTVHLTDGRTLRYFNGAWQDNAGSAAWWWDTEVEHAPTGF